VDECKPLPCTTSCVGISSASICRHARSFTHGCRFTSALEEWRKLKLKKTLTALHHILLSSAEWCIGGLPHLSE